MYVYLPDIHINVKAKLHNSQYNYFAKRDVNW